MADGCGFSGGLREFREHFEREHVDVLLPSVGESIEAEEESLFREFKATLEGWIGSGRELTLLYMARGRSISSTAFRAECTGMGPTLVLLSVERGTGVFGGYTVIPWTNSGWKKDESAQTFVFSLKNVRGDAPFRVEYFDPNQFATFLGGEPQVPCAISTHPQPNSAHPAGQEHRQGH